jgi:hypothetical protein
LIAQAVGASGVAPISDGLFEGTFNPLYTGITGWQTAKPDPILGAIRVEKDELATVRDGYSWMFDLLPYVGQGDLHAKFDTSKSWRESINRVYANVAVPAFLNPADPRVTWNGYPHRGLGLAHFAGMSGIENSRNEVAAELPRTDPRAGIFGYDRVARPAEITDGASQTIMIIGTGEVVGPWVQGGGATIRGARQPYFDKFTGFGSRGLQKTGTYVMFADGSARVISADINPEVFKAMCTIHGAETVDMSKLVSQGK